MTLGDRVVVMNEGRVHQCDTPLEIYRQPADLFVAGFVGMPPMNFMEGRLERGDQGVVFVGPDGCLPVSTAAEGLLNGEATRPIVAGVRPEAFTLTNEGQAGLAASVQVIEPLGSTMDVFLQGAAGRSLICRVPARPLDEQSLVTAQAAADHVYLFDPGIPCGRNLLLQP